MNDQKEPLFYQIRDQHYLPTLKLLHKCSIVETNNNTMKTNNKYLFFPIISLTLLSFILIFIDYFLVPDILPKVQVDRGAIRFVLKGADIMCPGLTSKGGKIDVELAAETPVCILAEGKENAIAIGLTKMSTEDIKNLNKGTGIENVHFLNDGLWNTNNLE